MGWVSRLPERSLLARLGLAVGGLTTSAFATLSFPALAPFERTTFSLSTLEVGALTALIYIGAVIAAVPAGRLTDVLGASRTLALGQLAIAVGAAVAALAPTRWLFLLAVVIAGLGYGAVNPATNVLATARISRRHRGLFMGAKQTGATLGGVLAGALVPSTASLAGWRVAMTLPIAGVAAGLAVSLGWARRHPAPRTVPRADAPDDDRPVARPPGPVARAVFSSIMAGTQFTFVGYLTVYLVDHEGFSSSRAGFALALMFVVASASRVAWGSISDRWGDSRAPALVLAACGCAVGFVLIALDLGAVVLWTGIIVIGLFGLGWNGAFLAMVVDSARAGDMGNASGQAMVFINGGVVLAPLLFGAVRDASSWPVTWGCASGGVAIAAATLALGAVRARAGETVPAAQSVGHSDGAGLRPTGVDRGDVGP